MINTKLPNRSLAYILILMDIFILPVSPIYSLPYSLVICLWLTVVRFQVWKFNYSLSFILLAITIIISTIFSYLFKDNLIYINNGVIYGIVSTHSEDLKRCIYFFIAFIYYQIFSLYCENNQTKSILFLKWVSMIVMILFGLFYVFFVFDHNLYFQIRNTFFGTDVSLANISALDYNGYFERYNFIFLDCNNASYFIALISIFYIEHYSKDKSSIYAWLILITSPFLTRSLGGAISVALYLLYKIIIFLKEKHNKNTWIKVLIILSIITIIIAIDSFLNFKVLDSIFNSQHEVFNRWSNNSMDGRISKYITLLSSDFPPLIGNGYTLIINNTFFSPHSDHLRFLYGYGIISYLILLVIVLNKKYFNKRYIFLIPILIAFSINSLIDEPRFLYSFLLFMAYENNYYANNSLNRGIDGKK